MTQKLYDLNMISEAREVIIVHLIEHNFLNEERFSKSYARGKFRIKKEEASSAGVRRIRAVLE